MKKLLLLSCFLFTGFILLAQGTKIPGTLTDTETHEPIADVNIVIKGILSGTTTDSNRKFERATTFSLFRP